MFDQALLTNEREVRLTWRDRYERHSLQQLMDVMTSNHRLPIFLQNQRAKGQRLGPLPHTKQKERRVITGSHLENKLKCLTRQDHQDHSNHAPNGLVCKTNIRVKSHYLLYFPACLSACYHRGVSVTRQIDSSSKSNRANFGEPIASPR